MKNEYLKTLWLLRFEKMRQSEEAAAWNYQDILDECLLLLGPEDPAIALLNQLRQEERCHAKMAEELIRICHQTHPEVGSL